MIRIAHVLGSMNQGGLENLIMNLLRNINQEEVNFSFIVDVENKAFYDDEIISMGCQIYRLGTRRQGLFKYQAKLKKILKEQSFDVIHVHTSSLSGIEAAILAKRYTKAKVIIHSHNTKGPSGLRHKINVFLNKRRVKKISDYQLACGYEAGIACFGQKYKEDLIILNNAIDAQAFNYNQEIRKKYQDLLGLANKKVIGNVARFMEQKNHLFLIDIFKEVYSIDSSFHLILVGVGELQPIIEQRIKEYQLEDNISLLG
ncbi:MAG: glycosyltransferase, partial [Bacilli bacterium]